MKRYYIHEALRNVQKLGNKGEVCILLYISPNICGYILVCDWVFIHSYIRFSLGKKGFRNLSREHAMQSCRTHWKRKELPESNITVWKFILSDSIKVASQQIKCFVLHCEFLMNSFDFCTFSSSPLFLLVTSVSPFRHFFSSVY